LIVTPVALIRQWDREINSKVLQSHRPSVYIYHGTRATAGGPFRASDIVITTYGTLASQLSREAKCAKDNRDDPNLNELLQKAAPLLYQQWFRVILDEAQFIKNKLTAASRAVCRLRTPHRWCLTGTPMMNSILELYAILKFNRIRPYDDWKEFKLVRAITPLDHTLESIH
jgi:SNF2 family DNA or RNA helicase